jgi:hypothetical protein
MDQPASPVPWPRWLAITLATAGLIAPAGVSLIGWPLHLYEQQGWLWLDLAQHIAAALLLGPMAVYVLPRENRKLLAGRPVHLILAATLLWMGLAGVWELFEWGMDMVFDFDLSKGYTDTLSDMLVALLGAALATTALLPLRTARS